MDVYTGFQDEWLWGDYEEFKKWVYDYMNDE